MVCLGGQQFGGGNTVNRYLSRSRSCLDIVVCLTAVILFAHPCFSDNVVSRPAGFVRVELVPQGNTLVSLPFVPYDDSIQSVFDGQLSGVPCVVRKWDAVGLVYTDATLQSDLWYEDVESQTLSTMTLNPGEGFAVRNGSAETQTVFFCGNVVLDAGSTVNLHPSLNLIGYQFSTRIDKDDVTLASETDLLMGKGYWYEEPGDEVVEWTEPRPYADPFPSSGKPSIVQMAVNGDGDAMSLTVSCSGAAGEALDIMYQDVSSDETFVSGNGWQLAAGNLAVGGASVVWTDVGAAGRESIDNVSARYYLVGRADIDTDADGLPDARELFLYATNPDNPDTDGDGMPDGWELANGLNPNLDDADGDPDGDGISNLSEHLRGTDPEDSRVETATIYVDATLGGDSNAGLSPASAKQTIGAAVQIAIPGDSIAIAEGIYREKVEIPNGVKMVARGVVRLAQ